MRGVRARGLQLHDDVRVRVGGHHLLEVDDVRVPQLDEQPDLVAQLIPLLLPIELVLLEDARFAVELGPACRGRGSELRRWRWGGLLACL